MERWEGIAGSSLSDFGLILYPLFCGMERHGLTSWAAFQTSRADWAVEDDWDQQSVACLTLINRLFALFLIISVKTNCRLYRIIGSIIHIHTSFWAFFFNSSRAASTVWTALLSSIKISWCVFMFCIKKDVPWIWPCSASTLPLLTKWPKESNSCWCDPFACWPWILLCRKFLHWFRFSKAFVGGSICLKDWCFQWLLQRHRMG